MVKMTGWVEFYEYDRKMRIRAKYGLDRSFAEKHGQPAYFSITCDVEEAHGRRWVDSGGGAAHEKIARHFPQLASLIRWHLCGENGPTHYVANAMYWADARAGRGRTNPCGPDPLAAFQSTVVFGSVPGDTLPDLVDRSAVQTWLDHRLPALLEAFRAAMTEAGVL